MLEVRVISITDFGVFVELERGVEGLVPMSELSYDRIDDARKVVQDGQIVRAEIIDVNPADRRLTLSLKKMELDANAPVIKFGEERTFAASLPGRVLGVEGSTGTTAAEGNHQRETTTPTQRDLHDPRPYHQERPPMGHDRFLTGCSDERP
jgi:transcriptional accessory protein Tex/SPT6